MALKARVGIRGVCPRGLIEAKLFYALTEELTLHPRGLPPRPH